MAQIFPFTAVTYHAQAGDPGTLICPPYDVISPEQQDALYAASPWNYVRIVLNAAPGSERYSQAAAALTKWLDAGILVEEKRPALYLYRQSFVHPITGRRVQRRGFFCALRLEPYSAGIVLPHEDTRSQAKEDRLRLMQATQANPEPIFVLYEDPSGSIASILDGAAASPPMIRADIPGDDADAGSHEVIRMDDAAAEAIARTLRDRPVWIADGHHRYETALAYRQERRTAEGNPPAFRPYDAVLAVLTSFDDPGLVVLPTHRLVRNRDAAVLDALPTTLAPTFRTEAVPVEELASRLNATRHGFGLVTRNGCWLLHLKDPAVMDARLPNRSVYWRHLDVVVLQELVFAEVLSIPSEALASTPDLGYTRNLAEAVSLVKQGSYQAAFLLPPPHADDVRMVAAAGERMPPKSTYFHPKLWSGLVLRLLK
ncbi:MAG: DUF1015 domain-containing protein [Chthonomonadales bacterium]